MVVSVAGIQAFVVQISEKYTEDLAQIRLVRKSHWVIEEREMKLTEVLKREMKLNLYDCSSLKTTVFIKNSSKSGAIIRRVVDTEQNDSEIGHHLT